MSHLQGRKHTFSFGKQSFLALESTSEQFYLILNYQKQL